MCYHPGKSAATSPTGQFLGRLWVFGNYSCGPAPNHSREFLNPWPQVLPIFPFVQVVPDLTKVRFEPGLATIAARGTLRMCSRIPFKDNRQRTPRPPGVRWLLLAGFAGMVLLNGGCVTTTPLEWIRNGFKVGPNYCRPPAPVAEDWIEAKDPNVQNRHLQDWWNVFDDPALNSLIDTAYVQNLNLRAIGIRVLEARAQQAIAAGNIFPQTQQATASYNRENLSHNTFNNPSAFSTLSPTPIPPGASVGNF
jgi:hypothetical protein